MLERYTEEEWDALEKHISAYFGPYDHVFHEIASPDIHVDLCIIDPTPERNFYTLVTMGMGAHRMRVPEELKEQKLERAELMISLPADWKIDQGDEAWYWPLRWLKILARLPIEEDSWLGWGHTVANPGEQPFAENTGFSGLILLSPGGFPEEASVCRLPDGSEVNFYAVVPLYREEMDYKCQNDAEALLKFFEEEPEEIKLLPLNLSRKNVCEHEKKEYYLNPEEIEPLLTDWNGPEGCIATDRITVEGGKVGYCYRQEPDREDHPWDSGWRFTAGDEDDDYMDDPDNSGIYSLNTICNVDREILPLLRSPYGSAFFRDEDGAFQPVEMDEDDEDDEEEKRPGLLRKDDIAALDSFQEPTSGYFGKMIQYLEHFIETGVREGRFSEREAHEDLEIALWYSYACNNIDDYEHYYLATQWMPDSEKYAKGCGTWYYRYSCALIYCSKMEQARDYAETGVREQPDYPWGWLQAAKLRAHFGDPIGALEAVAKGLELVPGDHEFTTLQKEILEGYTLEEMEYHYIDPDNDQQLQEGELADSEEKRQAIAGILCNREALEQIKALFQPLDWEADVPYCTFRFFVGEDELQGVFRMNEAALSKVDPDWLEEQRDKLMEGDYCVRGKEETYRLQRVVFDRGYQMQLVYQAEGSGRPLAVRAQKDDGRAVLPDPYLIDLALEQAEKEQDADEVPVVKLYRKESGTLSYAECWAEEDKIVEHTGVVGETGETETCACASAEEYQALSQAFQERYRAEGFAEWPEQENVWVVAQFPIEPVDLDAKPVTPSPQDTALRDLVQEALNEALGWTGLGRVDGWEMGRRLAMPEEFVLNVYCIAVDQALAVRTIREALETAADCSHLKIGVRPAGEEEYTLAYSADESEDFSL